MATLTLYCQNDTEPYAPATLRGAWDRTDAYADYKLGTEKYGSNTSSAPLVGSTDANYDILLGRFVSSPLAVSYRFGGTIDGVMKGWEYNAGVNAYVHLHVFALCGETDTLRGTIWSDYVGDVEVGTSAHTGRGFSGTMSDLSVPAGDTIVVEYGLRCSSASAGYQIGYGTGGTSGDVADSEAAADKAPWIRLTYTQPPVGTGAVQTSAVTLAGAGTVPVAAVGTGALTTAVVSLSGAMHLDVTGTGALTAASPALSGRTWMDSAHLRQLGGKAMLWGAKGRAEIWGLKGKASM